MPIAVKVLLVGLAIFMVGGTVYMLSNSVTGDDTQTARPSYVEAVIPKDDATVLSQSTVGIDLDSRFDAYLIVNNVPITNQATEEAPDGLFRNTEVGIIQYNPGPGKRVEALDSPKACVTAMIWEKIAGVETAEPLQWCFNVT